MRRSFDGLSALVKNHLGADPTNGHWYAFINRRRTHIKVLAFEAGGFCVWAKRLEAGQFAPVSGAGGAQQALSQVEFLALLDGVEMVIKRRRKRYKKAA